MSLLLLRRVGRSWTELGLVHHLLAPEVPPSSYGGSAFDAVVLANLWPLRRGRPYVAVGYDDTCWSRTPESEQIEYWESLPRLAVAGRETAGRLRYVGEGDVSPVVPRSEDDLLLLLPSVPAAELPSWPELVSRLNALYLTRSDDSIEIITTDHEVVELLDKLPLHGAGE